VYGVGSRSKARIKVSFFNLNMKDGRQLWSKNARS
jgi:hypothetical protein